MEWGAMTFPGQDSQEGCRRVLADLRRRRCALVDFDGTLADTAGAIVEVAREVLVGWGLPPEELGDVSRLVGPPFPDAFSEVYGLSKEDAAEVCRRYRAIADGQGPESHPAFPGALEAMGRLRDAGWRLCLTTSKREPLAASMLADLAMDPLFERVVGNDGHGRATKDVLVADSLSAMGVRATEAVMVGDRSLDVLGAHAAGVPCVAVDQGTARPGELEGAAADVIIAAIASLPEVLLG